MSTNSIHDFLTKQLFVEKNIVTYRSLSRTLGIHVNVAKNELAKFCSQSGLSPAPSATYLIIGESVPAATRNNDDSQMDIDTGNDSQRTGREEEDECEDGEDVPQTKFLLTNEEDLEDAKSKFQSITTLHIYSLSPSPIRDAGLLCAPTENVRQIDNSKNGLEIAVTIGKVISKQVNMKETRNLAPVASTSTVKPAPLPKQPSSAKIDLKEKEKPKEKMKDDKTLKPQGSVIEKPKEKPKATGKLDFSKQKSKEAKKEDDGGKGKGKGKGPQTSLSDTDSGRVVEKKSSSKLLKRGLKRKSTGSVLSETDDTTTSMSEAPKRMGGLRVKRRAVLSDDEHDPRPSLRRTKTLSVTMSEVGSEQERSLRAMMDIDDGEVSQVPSSKPPNDSENDDDMAMSEDDDPVPKPSRKKRTKKVMPVGSNGLKKRRVVKTRTKFDAQGYRVTEDYSSYESVDEEQSEPEVPRKGGRKLKTVEKVKDDPPRKTPTAVKRAESLKTKGGSTKLAGGSAKLGPKGSITNFFGPAKSK